MGLKTYRSKREFEKTPEPLPKKGKKGAALRFCVQKHAASHLHYDFRLELDGVLLSWAIPKGPSMNPKDKRLAMHVEDHPLDYRTFEGVIPQGNYGAGKVMLWDDGTYEAVDADTKAESEKKMRAGMAKGHLEFTLHGEKLNGKFALIHMKSSKNTNAWLLVKAKDEFASTGDVTDLDYSVKKKSKKVDPIGIRAIPKKKKPEWVAPMLAKLIEKPFDSDEWLFEIKWDGYRILAYVEKDKVELFSRKHILYNKNFPDIAKDLKKLKTDAIFDGEVVSLDKKGISKFELLANYQRNHQGNLCYYIFDLLYYKGRDLRDLPLVERRAILKQIFTSSKSEILRFSDDVQDKGVRFFREAAKKGLEGIIGKRKKSSYISRRSSDWVKIKTSGRQEMVVGGFTKPRGSRSSFGALLLGVYDKGELKFVGRVGTGFDTKTLKEVYEKMKPLIQEKPPFKTTPKSNHDVTWLKPKLVAEISFAEWTKDKKLRQPVFHGLRSDKDAKEVKFEKKSHVAK